MVRQSSPHPETSVVFLPKSTKLKEIMDNKNYTEIFEDEKELLWKVRAEVCERYPESLSKLLLITKWNKHEEVVQVRRRGNTDGWMVGWFGGRAGRQSFSPDRQTDTVRHRQTGSQDNQIVSQSVKQAVIPSVQT